jgi:hypothetical protein
VGHSHTIKLKLRDINQLFNSMHPSPFHRYRSVILLHDAHSLTAAEIAELLGESVGTMKIRLHRAPRRLQEIMRIGCAVSQTANGVPCCEPKLLEAMLEDDLQSLPRR